MPPDEARLLERLLADPHLRRRFESDPAGGAREEGFYELADELIRADPRDARRLGARESRSSAAGVVLAGLFEGLGFLHDGALADSSVDRGHEARAASDFADQAGMPVGEAPQA